MPAPSGSGTVASGPTARLRELGIVLPVPPTPLGAYVESSDVGHLLYLSGMLPVVNRRLAVAVADGASEVFVNIFGSEAGHVRLVYGVQSLPVGAPLIVDTIFEIAR